MEIAVQIGLNTIVAGSIYALVALGFNLIYSTARFFDLGYGALAAVGGYVVFFLSQKLGWNIFPSIGLGILVAGALGFLVEKVVYRQLRARRASSTVLLIASLGVLTVIQAIIAIIFSSQFQTLARDIGNARVFWVFGGVITEVQVIILGSAILIMAILAWTLKHTLFGKAIKAVSDDEEVAQIVGINSEKVIGGVFFIGSAIAGVAGIATGFDTGLLPTIGLALLLNGVIAAIVGGVGNVYGGVLGAFALGLAENIGAWVLPGEWKFAIAFAVLILFLIFRPQGILPK